MRNRVGKQIVFVLLALLLVFGVATSAGAEVLEDGALVKNGDASYILYFKNSVSSLSNDDMVSLCQQIDLDSWNTYGQAYFVHPNGGWGGYTDKVLWESNTNYAGDALSVGVEYILKMKNGVETKYNFLGKPYQSPLYAEYTIVAKIFDNLTVTKNLDTAKVTVTVNDKTVDVDENGTTVSVIRGESATVTAQPKDGYNCSVVNGSEVFSDLTGDMTVAVQYADRMGTVQIGENTGVDVTLNGYTNPVTGKINDEVSIVAKIKSGVTNKYIAKIEVLDSKNELMDSADANTLSFKIPSDDVYTVKVTVADSSLAMKSGIPFVGGALTKEALVNLLDANASIPAIAADSNVKVEFYAGLDLPVIGKIDWVSFDSDIIGTVLSYLDSDSIQVRYTHTPANTAVYGPVVLNDVTVYLNEKTRITLEYDNQPFAYEATDAEIIEGVLKAVETSYDSQNWTAVDVDAAVASGALTGTVNRTMNEDGTFTVTVTYNDVTETVNVKIAAPTATVKAGSGDVTFNFTSPATVEANKEYTVSAELNAKQNKYIQEIEVVDQGGTVVAAAKTANAVTFTPVNKGVYTVNVTVGDTWLKTKNNGTAFVGTNPTEDDLLTLVDLENSFPKGINLNDVNAEIYVEAIEAFGQVIDINSYVAWGEEYDILGIGKINPTKIYLDTVKPESLTIRFIYEDANTDVYAPIVSDSFILSLVKEKVVTQVNLKSGVTVDYSEDLTKEDILALVFENVTDVNGNVITSSTKDVKISGIVAAGQQKFVVTYAGSDEYVKSSNEVTVTINKATATVDVVSKIVRYGQKPTGMINVNPAPAAFISFYAGLNANDQATVIHVNLPHLVDTEGLEGIIPGVSDWVSKLEDDFEVSVSLSKLGSTLSGLLKELNKYDNLPVNVDTTSINMLVKVLDQVGQLEGIGDPMIELSIGDAELPTDAGAYLVGAVVSDMNYNTAADLGYLVIKPDGTRVDLAFNIEDENCIVTREAILSGSYDLGSHVEQGSLTDAQLAEASDKLVNVYAGVNLDGEFYVDNAPSADIGAYTQLAYIRDFGNTMYYAVPIARAYVVVADTVNIYFIDENGNENDERLYTYDGNGKSMTAVAYTKAGEKLNSKDITYYYIGIEGDAEGYYAKNPSGSKLPTEAGVYTVIATYINENQSLFGVTAGAMVIQPAEAEIDVTNKLVGYTGKQVSVTDMIDKDPDDAAVTIIVASVNVAGDFSEDGFSALEGYVNFDLPTRMDNVIKQIIPNAYENGVSVSTVKSKLKEAMGVLGEADVAQIKELQELLNKIDNSVTLTFKETKNVATKDIGMYLVIGAITDPNYRFDADAGLLVIAPNVDTAELKWNYTDSNGIITLPKLDAIDMGATAYNKNGEAVNELTAKIDYIYIGVDEKGESVFVKNPASLGNGLYTEIAYIYEKEVSANMWVVKPIMRQVLIVTQTVNVKVTDKTVNYDGNRHAVDVSVKTKDGSAVDYNSLTVTYTGLNTDGAYHSTTAPKEVGIYSVVATYEVRNNNGDVKYFGMDAGVLTIKPVTSDVDVVYTEVAYDGTEKMATINAADGLNLIKVVVDSENNINIILPENVYSGTKTFDVSGALTSVEQELKNLDKDVLDTLIAVIQKINSKVGTLSINGKQPVEVGTYTVYAIAYAANTVPSYDFDRLVITGAGQATATPTPVVTATPVPVNPDATPTPVVTATPAPVDPDATPTPVVTATPAPVDPDATPTTAPTATTAPEAPATAAPSDAPTATPKPLPSTGDQSHNALWMLLMIFSGAALLLVCRKMTVKGR